MNTGTGRVRVLGPRDGEILGDPGSATDRFMIDGKDTAGRFAVVEHMLAPGVLAAPLHRHTEEDEFSYILQGRVGAVFDSEEIVAEAGDLVSKPRGEWHTFWNAGDGPARILEIISPAGLEDVVRMLDALTEPPDPETLTALAARRNCDVDLEDTMPIVERHGLIF